MGDNLNAYYGMDAPVTDYEMPAKVSKIKDDLSGLTTMVYVVIGFLVLLTIAIILVGVYSNNSSTTIVTEPTIPIVPQIKTEPKPVVPDIKVPTPSPPNPVVPPAAKRIKKSKSGYTPTKNNSTDSSMKVYHLAPGVYNTLKDINIPNQQNVVLRVPLRWQVVLYSNSNFQGKIYKLSSGDYSWSSICRMNSGYPFQSLQVIPSES